MGGKPTKEDRPGAKKDKICLGVLHSGTPTNMDNFRKAMHDYEPPGSLKIAEKKDWNVSDPSEDLVAWMKDRATSGYIVLICLLTNYNFQALKEGIDRKDRIFEFCFQDPIVDGVILVDVNITTATPQDIIDKSTDLVTEIRGR